MLLVSFINRRVFPISTVQKNLIPFFNYFNHSISHQVFVKPICFPDSSCSNLRFGYQSRPYSRWPWITASLLFWFSQSNTIPLHCSENSIDKSRMSDSWIEIGTVQDFPAGSVHEVKIPGTDNKVLLSNTNGTLFCSGSRCPHFNAPLKTGVASSEMIICPWHAAHFDLRTGVCKDGPSLQNIPVFPVKIDNETVLVKLPEQFSDSCVPLMVKRDPEDSRLYLIIGGGAAAMGAAEQLRQEGYKGRIVMCTAELNQPYERPILSKNLAAKVENLFLRPLSFFEEWDIEFRPNCKVSNLNTKEKVAELESGEKIAYTKVLIATGTKPNYLRIPGSELSNVFTYRNLSDFENVKKYAKDANRVVIIGSSFTGIELSYALKKMGADVTVIGMEEVPHQRVFGKRVGGAVKQVMLKNGVKFYGETAVKQFHTSNSRVNGVEINSGEILQADCVVLAIGGRPETSILDDTFKSENGKIQVDPFMIVNGDDTVVAAGDIVMFPYRKTGKHIHIEHWNVAMQQGRIAAKSMCGKRIPFDSIPYFWTQVFGANIRYAGYCSDPSDVIIEGDLSVPKFVAYYFENERVVAVASYGKESYFGASCCEALKLNLLPSKSDFEMGLFNSQTLMERLKAENIKKATLLDW